MSKQTALVKDKQPVYSILPHELIVLIGIEVVGSTRQRVEIILRPGDNDIPADLWTKAKERPAIKRRLDEGFIQEGRIARAPKPIQQRVWTGERDEYGVPLLTPAGTGWIGEMCPKAARVTDANAAAQAARLRAQGVMILSDAELAGLR